MIPRRYFRLLRAPWFGLTGVLSSGNFGKKYGRLISTWRYFNNSKSKSFLTSPFRGRGLTAARALSSFEAPLAAKDASYFEDEIKSFDHDAPLIESWGSKIPLRSTSISSDGQMMSVLWEDGDEQEYPAVWLRDNCHCASCHHKTYTRSTYLTEMSFETGVRDATLLENGQILYVEWDDDHHAVFPTDWLRGHRFDQSPRDPIEGPRPTLWGNDIMSTPHFKLFQFDDVMESDSALYDWLEMVYHLGIGILKKAPTEHGVITRLHKRLGYDSPAPSSWGILNQVKLQFDGSHHPVHTEKRLQLHNDTGYYTYPKKLQMFHCIQQVSGGGGDSLLVDGFKVAEDLRSQNPEAFKILSTVDWEYKLFEGINYHVANQKAIRLDAEGAVCQIVINDICRTAMLRIPPRDVRKAYEALKEFTNMLYLPINVFQYKLQPGDLVVFNNHRVLHGRVGFNLHAKAQRHIEACYSDWEIVSARMRSLQKERLVGSQK